MRDFHGLRNRSVRAVLATLAVVALTATAAFADTRTFEDADDADGKLDIASITQGHARSDSGKRLLTYTVKTYEGWSVNGFGRDSMVSMDISTDGDRAVERSVIILKSDGKLVALVTAPGRFIGYGTVSHPDRHTLELSFRRRMLGKGVESYRWLMMTAFSRAGYEGCEPQGDVVQFCGDQHPESGRRVHNLG